MKSVFSLSLYLIFSLTVFAQTAKKIDHLTLQEDEIVHNAQELDARTAVYIKIIQRRLLALNGATIEIIEKENKKDKRAKEDWGELPTGTAAELLGDIKSVLNEAVNKIDDWAEHNPKSPLLPKSLKILSEGCQRFAPQLKAIYEKSVVDAERSAAYDAAQICQEIFAAQNNKSTAAEKSN
jgi:hypothetical protein